MTERTIAATSTSPHRAIAAAAIGNLLEAYDFAVYGYFAVTLSRLFFPTGDATTSLLLTVATFGVGFVMRPLGAIVLGTLADRRGRKAALSVTIVSMAVGTAVLGVAPTYAQIGAWAPALVVAARLVQGFSAGGEVGTATVFLTEHAPEGRRGFIASWQQAGQAAALLLGSLMGVVLTAVLSAQALQSWGWRIPFLLGLLIGPVGFYLRSRTHESAEFTEARTQMEVSGRRSVLADTLRRHPRAVATGFAITITWTVATYFFLVYLPTYAQRALHLSATSALVATSAGPLVVVVLAPMFGALSDRIGRRRLLLGGATVIVLLTYPAMALLKVFPGAWSVLVFQIVFAIPIAAFTGPAPAAMAEVCPPQVRSTTVSVGYNLAVALFGGFAPFIVTWLVAATGNALSPAWYVVATCAVSTVLIAVLYSGRAYAQITEPTAETA
ncbi:MFS transporter [Amycolatopsis benzoatilytica]|uniref:MFS transporter n=1 Tax=Amycolatopsis benzoatilytica TaxID=346045 RepID=UPI000399868E|nr:MFS transporter [Amycolatopsis benzoatilytica]